LPAEGGDESSSSEEDPEEPSSSSDSSSNGSDSSEEVKKEVQPTTPERQKATTPSSSTPVPSAPQKGKAPRFVPSLPGRQSLRQKLQVRRNYKDLDKYGLPGPSNDQTTAQSGSSEDEVDAAVKATAVDMDRPSYKQAMEGPDAPLWEGACDEEIGKLVQHNTLELCVRPPGCPLLIPLWVLLAKRNQEGQVVRHKARLVVQGNHQRPGVDFGELFAHIVRSDTLRLLFAVATVKDWDIHGVDVASAFLNGEVEEELYMRQIPGYEDGTDRVMRIKGSLYGLRQAP
jgi:hypothetical protein